ncbi:MAG TPA: hypothetical protein VK968_13445 [Roseimicrobium sp.]|nr:hypothetical protein [Roseimicrobium sp.]
MIRLLIYGQIIVLASLVPSGWGQTPSPATNPAASTVSVAWDDIDKRLVFFTVQLASVETSVDAVNKALKAAGYKISVRADDAVRFQKGNELMDRNAGGPRRWQDFYGETAEKFFYNPVLQPGELRITASVLRTDSSNARMPGPADQRPPQFDYIYRANENAKAQAEMDISKLAGKVDQLLIRRRQLEAEQSGLWCKIATRAVAGREMLSKPLYRFDLKNAATDPTSAQQLEAMRAAMDFLRVNNKLIELAEKGIDSNQAGFIEIFEQTVAKSRIDFDTRISKQSSLVMDSGDKGTTIGKLSAVAKRMNDVAKNVKDAYKLSLDGENAGDEQRKVTFRAQLQDSLVTYAQTVLAGDECVTQLAAEWKIAPDLEKRAETSQMPSVPEAVKGPVNEGPDVVAMPAPTRSAAMLVEAALSKRDAAKKAADAEAIASLEEALVVAAKTRKEEEVARVTAEIQKIKALANDRRANPLAEIVDVEWVGSPNLGRIVFRRDGTFWSEKKEDERSRWVLFGNNTLLSMTDAGYVSVFQFDENRTRVNAYAVGQKGTAVWQARRSGPK